MVPIGNPPVFLGEKIREFLTCQSQQSYMRFNPKGNQTLLYFLFLRYRWGITRYFTACLGIINYDFDLSVSRFPKKRGQNNHDDSYR